MLLTLRRRTTTCSQSCLPRTRRLLVIVTLGRWRLEQMGQQNITSTERLSPGQQRSRASLSAPQTARQRISLAERGPVKSLPLMTGFEINQITSLTAHYVQESIEWSTLRA